MSKLLFSFLLILITGCAPSVRYADDSSSLRLRVKRDQEEIAMRPAPYKTNAQVRGPLIIIDPGHGGEDTGTISLSKPRYQEKSLTLSTSKILAGYLNQMGYQTQMTRSDDTFISLQSRANFANELEPALFVSVHYNSAPSKEAQGIEVFYYQSETDKSRTKSSKDLAATILDQVIQNTDAKSRGVKTGNFAVIRETKMPAILIEGGFLTNQDEMVKIKDPAYIKRLAYGIARGVDSYVRKIGKS